MAATKTLVWEWNEGVFEADEKIEEVQGER